MSSRSAVYNGSRDDSTRGAQTATFRAIPNNPTYNIDRFVGGNGQSSRAPLGFSQKKAETTAIAQSQARASAVIHTFDTQFNPGYKPPHQ
ncbi:uncharacterized protein TRIVIDRAFT_228001 [Trichoderma virens Gv29-8]|uniref:Uncharacterized protein n=1 Tax=Hypocrea virens (strain Gv29-8 / FGSC 10586) TaxID=413071 RepID=G9NB61_HYPVG|nr:uncharacterized protein TRIVIDRAFT_228001 [Trichoderma virens Gv29-8]EHK16069.1 hypothetical protein TRIVIDRAFT_228001 [Trichoderma virens Gv29-8]UKZ56154.1 hypothetical protein TrVGV298_009982 [Trichoderma virens]